MWTIRLRGEHPDGRDRTAPSRLHFGVLAAGDADERARRAPLYCITGRCGRGHERHYVCRHTFESDGICDARPILADSAEFAVLTHLHAFVGNVQSWLAERFAERGHEQAHIAAVVARERSALAALDRKLAQAQECYVAALDDDQLAAVALRQVARIEAERMRRHARSRTRRHATLSGRAPPM